MEFIVTIVIIAALLVSEKICNKIRRFRKAAERIEAVRTRERITDSASKKFA